MSCCTCTRCLLAPPVVYRRREPEKTVLYQAVAEHLPAFLASAEETDRPVPKFVRRELEGFLVCGIVEKGAVRVRCPTCGFDRLVACSCKSRSGLCSSCGARRMLDVSTHLCTNVIPDVPVRQWVITVPPPVRYLLAYDAELLAHVVRIFVHAVFAHLRLVARRELSVPDGARIEAGGVCVPQRFNSALGLAPHLHALVADGVWVQSSPDAQPTFHALPAPSNAELAAVAWSVCERTVKLLKKRGQWVDADPGEDRLAQEQPLLAGLASASIAGVLCRYLLRPPLSNDRLTRTEEGKYVIKLKRAWDNGTSAIVVRGEELFGRLALLVPPPRVHTTRYFGVWAPRSNLRRMVVPTPPETPQVQSSEGTGDTPHTHRYRLSWAQALAKVFEIDIAVCPRCRQRGMQQIAVIHDAGVLRAMLASMARETEPP
ncbi:MAG: transposase [Myxococcota bacterium]